MGWPVEGYPSRNNRFSRPTKNCRPPKLVDSIFEVWWHLWKFWRVKQIFCIDNGFALRDFFAKRTKFRVVRTGPKNNPANHAPGRCRGNDELIKSNCLRGPAFLYERIFHFKEEIFSIFRYEILESRLLCARPQSRRSLATSTACQGSPTGKGQSDW